MTLPVSHYLRIYKLRQSMAQVGITHPDASGIELIDKLVSRLGRLDPGLPCHLVHEPGPNGGEWISFVVEGEEQARIWINPEDGPIEES